MIRSEIVAAVTDRRSFILLPQHGILFPNVPDAASRKEQNVCLHLFRQAADPFCECIQCHAIEGDALAIVAHWPEYGSDDLVQCIGAITIEGKDEVVEVVVFDEGGVVEAFGRELPGLAIVFYLWDDGDGEGFGPEPVGEVCELGILGGGELDEGEVGDVGKKRDQTVFCCCAVLGIDERKKLEKQVSGDFLPSGIYMVIIFLYGYFRH